MRIAIIGGGASGLITAWLLQQHHEVEVFEKASIAGGHVRTLNRNVTCPNLPPHVSIENGVLGFHIQSYPHFMKLMQKLQVPVIYDKPTARLYIEGSEYPVSPKTFLRTITLQNLFRKGKEIVKLLRMNAAYKKFLASLDKIIQDTPPEAPTAPFLSPNKEMKAFHRAMLMLSFSTPIEFVDELPVGLTLPFLAALRHPDWCYVKGGVYHYQEALLNAFHGMVHVNTTVDHVGRSPDGVSVHFANGDAKTFDKVVFATTPGKILGMIQSPSEAEHRCFSPWHDRSFETIAHTDAQMYRGFDPVSHTPMDFFMDAADGIAGYNTSMNRAYQLSDHPSVAFAYNLDQYIRPEHILDRQSHIVPVYTTEAFRTRPEIKQLQGENHCYYVGAWLGNGLHEGAASSAVEVAIMLGAEW